MYGGDAIYHKYAMYGGDANFHKYIMVWWGLQFIVNTQCMVADAIYRRDAMHCVSTVNCVPTIHCPHHTLRPYTIHCRPYTIPANPISPFSSPSSHLPTSLFFLFPVLL